MPVASSHSALEWTTRCLEGRIGLSPGGVDNVI